ncbi:MAG: haloacid dehalogenase-like hydrolase [Clostridia bacterium]|nr:haloacid dehalogenase-like hydrolase [Clostridia bacterium]
MSKGQTAAILYDFDKTLSTKDMQEYAFIPGIGMTAEEFWDRCDTLTKKHNMDQILSYMYVMLNDARGKKLLNRDEFKNLGESVELFPGVDSWFERVNSYAEKLGINVEHYVISSGLKEIIEGTPIAKYFKKVYAAEFMYDKSGVPIWPAMAVNYTSKTQFLFRINKGVLDVTDHAELNEYTPENERRIPFRNMIYIGDGFTDVPCMKLVKVNGGHSIAVYSSNENTALDIMRQGRVDFIAKADYRENEKLEETVFKTLDLIKAKNVTEEMHILDTKSAE